MSSHKGCDGRQLEPCPFCGGEARLETYGGTSCAVVCQACHSGTPTMRLEDGERAVELWNRRARPTCRNTYEDDQGGRIRHGYCEGGFECSECGEIVEDFENYGITGTFNFCPGCGRKVGQDHADG